jgi:hypothetical protein
MLNRCPQFKLVSSSRGDMIFSFFNYIPPDDETGDYEYWDNISQDWRVSSYNVLLGFNNLRTNPENSTNTTAVGYLAGNKSQESNALAIGANTGQLSQRQSAVAIGQLAGFQTQGTGAIAIGQQAGQTFQGQSAIAIGRNAGRLNQKQSAIAIGQQSGQINQNASAIAIGSNAGQQTQQQYAIAIGTRAGQYNQNQYTTAIGTNAGQTNQESQSMVLNATMTPVNPASPGLFVNPVRGAATSLSILSYNTETNEIYFNGSSRRYKHNIVPLNRDTSVVYKLVPREFDYNLNGEHDIGLIAEEANEVDPQFAYIDKDGIPEGIQWQRVTTYLVAELQRLKKQLTMIKSTFKKG